MINARLESLRSIDDELFNRVIARGPGGGIDRVSVTVEDANSIAKYGLRETTQDFVSAGSKAELVALAAEFLSAHNEPITEMEITFFIDVSEPTLESVLYNGEAVLYGGEELSFWRYGRQTEVRRGDTIRIVSQSLGLNVNGTIEEVDWEPGQVTLSINKKRYNLLEVINGPEEDDERRENSLGLPVPIGFRAQRATPGVRVFVNPYSNSRATGVEIYASLSSNFTPSREYLIAKGSSTEYLFPDLSSGNVFYFKARSYDQKGNFSDFTEQAIAISGYVDGGRIEEGSITDLTPFASALSAPKLVTSLPVLPDPDYDEDTLVAFQGEVYRQVGGVWQVLTDLSVLDGRLVANRLVSAQIEAGAIRAEQIAVNAVTADKILVNGPVTVANGDSGQEGAFIVLDESDEEVLRLGAGINDKPGVPAGISYGLWGALGTGAFISGAMKLVDVGSLVNSATVPAGTYAAGDAEVVQLVGPDPLYITAFEVPVGKKWVVRMSLSDYGYNTTTNFAINSLDFFPTAYPTAGGSSNSFTLVADSYDSIYATVSFRIIAVTGFTLGSGVELSYTVNWDIVEVDA